MKAVVLTRYGPPEVLELQYVEKPVPKEDEILVRVKAASVSMGDCEMRSLNMPFFLRFLIRLFMGVFKPRKQVVLGQEIAGVVDSVGENVTKIKPEDEIFGQLGFEMGGYAEYVIFSDENFYSKKPNNMTFKEAAVFPVGGFNSLSFLEKANIQSGQKVLINGAGGSIGTIAVQIAKSYGAKVTAVDSTEKLDMLLSIGADHVIDYTKEDFTAKEHLYDVIFDVVGKAPYKGCIQSIKKGGFFLIANPRFTHSIRKRWTKRIHKITVIAGTAKESIEDLETLVKMIENGKIKSVIDKTFSLEQAVEAHRYVETGRKKGNVVISIKN